MPSDLVIKIRAQDGDARSVLKGVSGAVEDVGKSALSPSKLLGGFSDVMGKVGLAALGVQAAVGAATTIVSGLVGPAIEAQQVTAQLQSVLASTGGAAGVTQGAVEGLSQSLSRVTTFEDEAITSAQSLLLTFTNIGKDVFPAATETVLDMSQALGQDLKSSSVQLGKALNDPIKGITALSRVGVSFTEDQKDMIKAMVEGGDVAGAQAVILQELQKEFGGAARAAGETFAGQLTILQNELGNVVETIGGPAVGALTDLMRFVLPLVQAFGEWLPGALDAFMGAVGPVVDFIAGEAIYQLRLLGEMVTLVFAGDFQGAVDLLQTSILPSIQEFGAIVLGWVGEQLPVLAEQLGQWAQKFIEWLGPAIPPLLAELGNLLNNVLAWLGAHVPVLVAGFADWALVAISWVLDSLPGLIANLGAMFNAIVGWVRAHAPGLIETFIAEFVPAAIVWVARAAVEIVTHLPGILFAIGKWVVTEGIPGLNALGADLGAAIVRGLAAGIRNLAGTVASEARAVAQRAIDAATSLLQPGSPSRVFMRIGESIGEGLAAGMGNLQGRVSEAARAMTGEVIPPAERTREAFVSLTNDGMGLATAGARNLAESLTPIGGVLSGLIGSVGSYASALRDVPSTVTTQLAIQGQATALGGVTSQGGQPSQPQGGNPGDPPEVRAAGGWAAYNAQNQSAPRNPDGTVKKQWGGRLWAGQAAIVGEGGPELVVARQNVDVVPNHTMRGLGGGAGGGVVNVYLTVQGSVLTERDLLRTVREGLLREKSSTLGLGLA